MADRNTRNANPFRVQRETPLSKNEALIAKYKYTAAVRPSAREQRGMNMGCFAHTPRAP